MADIDIDPSLLKGDFDPEKHEELVEKLAANLGEDELDENGEMIKVNLNQLLLFNHFVKFLHVIIVFQPRIYRNHLC